MSSSAHEPKPPSGANPKPSDKPRAGAGITGMQSNGKLSDLMETKKKEEALKDETNPETEDNGVRKNPHGGVYVADSEIQAAFDVLDADKNGFITLNNLKKRLGVFFPDMTPKEYRFLMNNQKEMTLDDLQELLSSNTIENFDPVAEAFKLYDTDNTGYIKASKLKEIFQVYGLGEVPDEDVDILGRAADIDGDGKISLADFRMMLEGEGAVMEKHVIQDHSTRAKEEAVIAAKARAAAEAD
jgi:calmodulin